MVGAIAERELISTEHVVVGVVELCAAFGRSANETTHAAFDRALSGSMTHEEWRLVLDRAIRNRRGMSWYWPGALLDELEQIRDYARHEAMEPGWDRAARMARESAGRVG